MKKVFVYGTLMKGQLNNYLLSDSKYLGDAVLKGYALNNIYNARFPAISKKQNCSVTGEVYEIDEETEANLDSLEGVHYNLYDKSVEVIQMIEGEQNYEAIAYVVNKQNRLYPYLYGDSEKTHFDKWKLNKG